MDKFLIGFAVGLGLGAGLAMLLSPEPGPAVRERLRLTTDRYAGGNESPLGSMKGMVAGQRNRLEEAVAAGRRASAETQSALWDQLHLAPPSDDDAARRRPKGGASA